MVHLFKANFDVCHVSFRQNLKHVVLFSCESSRGLLFERGVALTLGKI